MILDLRHHFVSAQYHTYSKPKVILLYFYTFFDLIEMKYVIAFA